MVKQIDEDRTVEKPAERPESNPNEPDERPIKEDRNSPFESQPNTGRKGITTA